MPVHHLLREIHCSRSVCSLWRAIRIFLPGLTMLWGEYSWQVSFEWNNASTGTSQGCSTLLVCTTAGMTFCCGSSLFEAFRWWRQPCFPPLDCELLQRWHFTSSHPGAAIFADNLCGLLIIEQRMMAICRHGNEHAQHRGGVRMLGPEEISVRGSCVPA